MSFLTLTYPPSRVPRSPRVHVYQLHLMAPPTPYTTSTSTVSTDALIATVLFTSALLHTLYTVHVLTFSLAVASAILSFINLLLLAIRRPERPFRYATFPLLLLATILLVSSIFITLHPTSHSNQYITQYNDLPNSPPSTDPHQQQHQLKPHNVDSMRLKDLAVAETIALVSRKQDETLANLAQAASDSERHDTRPTLSTDAKLSQEHAREQPSSTLPNSSRRKLLSQEDSLAKTSVTLRAQGASDSLVPVPVLAHFAESW